MEFILLVELLLCVRSSPTRLLARKRDEFRLDDGEFEAARGQQRKIK